MLLAIIEFNRKFSTSIGVEITGWTLETIYKKDKNWIKNLNFY